MANKKTTPGRSRPSPMFSGGSAPDSARSPQRVAIYPRVSTDGQSVESQIAELTRFAEARGWTLAAPPETYVDDGISGTLGTGGRDGLRRLIEDAARGAFDVVAVCGISRITRADDWIDRAAAVGGLQRAGVFIADAHTGALHDMATEQGDLLVGLGAFLASVERKNILRQTARGKRQALAAGRKHQGVDPYGYVSGTDRVLHIREDEGQAVREIFELVLAGRSCREVAEVLNARGRPLRARGNGALRWSRDRVREIARSPLYRGEFVADRAAGAVLLVPALVDDARWYAAQAALHEHRPPGRAPAGPRRVALASGRAVCGLCGLPIRIVYGSKPYTRYYVCRARARPELGASCRLTYRRVDDLDAELWAKIEELLAGGWRRLAAEMDAAAEREPDAERRRVQELEARVGRLGRARAVVLRQHADGTIDDLTLERELASLAFERDTAASELARLRESAAGRWSPDDLSQTMDTIRETLSACEPADRLEIVRALIPGHAPYVITVRDDAVEAVLRLDPRAWLAPSRGSSRCSPRTTYPAVLDVRLAC
jgi:DNA invertase Pin-like site-specific DNA recombinase